MDAFIGNIMLLHQAQPVVMFLRQPQQNVGVKQDGHLEAAIAIDRFPTDGFFGKQGCIGRKMIDPCSESFFPILLR